MKVYVKSQSGKWLMPTNPENAGTLFTQGKAKVIQRTPFALQLLYETTEYIQPVTVGIDDGGIHIGIAAVSHGQPWSLLKKFRRPFAPCGHEWLSDDTAAAIEHIVQKAKNECQMVEVTQYREIA